MIGETSGTETVNILLVDDHAENLLALRAILEMPGHRLVSAASGAEALKALLKEDFALILLDVMMPAMDGYETAAFIKERENTRHIPIIFLTAVAKDMDHIFRGYSVGAVDYLLKPLEADVVRAKVSVFAELYRKSREIRRQARLLAENERREKQYQLAALERAQEMRYQHLSESIPQIIWTARPDGTVIYCNHRWRDYTGFTFEEMANRGWLNAIHPEDRERVGAAWDQALRARRIYSEEYRLYNREKDAYLWNLARAIPTLDPTGKVVEWFGSLTHIEEQKRAEIELQETLRSRDEFFSITSHELKTPITSLKLQLQLLSRTIRKSGEALVPAKTVLERVDIAGKQTDRLVRLVENLLDVTRIRERKLAIERETLNLAAIVRDVVSRFSEQLKASGSPLTASIDDALEGEFDRMRMEQVATNLISNAIKYGDGTPIEVSLRQEAGTAVFAVKDRGIGIPADDQVRIFERFERAVSSKDFSGLGLGLYITQQIIQAHGGTIRVESVPHEGSTFTVRLPMHPLAAEAGGKEERWHDPVAERSS